VSADEMRNVWRVHTTDTEGRPCDLYVGQVEHDGKLETALRVDNGPIVLIPLLQVAGDVLAAIRQTSEAVYLKNAQEDR
jgi:hypothetical protein